MKQNMKINTSGFTNPPLSYNVHFYSNSSFLPLFLLYNRISSKNNIFSFTAEE